MKKNFTFEAAIKAREKMNATQKKEDIKRLREFIATQAMAAIISKTAARHADSLEEYQAAAEGGVRYADALIKELEQ